MNDLAGAPSAGYQLRLLLWLPLVLAVSREGGSAGRRSRAGCAGLGRGEERPDLTSRTCGLASVLDWS